MKDSTSAVKTGLLDKWFILLPLNFPTHIRSYHRIFWSGVYGLSAFPYFVPDQLKYALENTFIVIQLFSHVICHGPLIPSHRSSEEDHALLLLFIVPTEQLVETLAICSFMQFVLWLFLTFVLKLPHNYLNWSVIYDIFSCISFKLIK